jgi:hypothetical protein
MFMRSPWLRASVVDVAKQVITPKPQQSSLELKSPYQLLRRLLKSIDTKVKSRHGRKFLRQRLLSQWRFFRTVNDPFQQRFVMERAAAVLTSLHLSEVAKKQGGAPDFDWSKADKPSKLTRRELFDKEFK